MQQLKVTVKSVGNSLMESISGFSVVEPVPHSLGLRFLTRILFGFFYLY